jgi:hypothetical protein
MKALKIKKKDKDDCHGSMADGCGKSGHLCMWVWISKKRHDIYACG